MITKCDDFIIESRSGDPAFKELVEEIKRDFDPNRIKTETWINPGKYIRYTIDDKRAIQIRFWYKEIPFALPIKRVARFDAEIIDREKDDEFGKWVNKKVSQYLIRDFYYFLMKENAKHLGIESSFTKLKHKIFGRPNTNNPNPEIDPYGEEVW